MTINACSLVDQSHSSHCLLDMWHDSFLSACYWMKHAPLPIFKTNYFCNPFLSEINLFTYILTSCSKTGRNSFNVVMILSYLWHIILAVVTNRHLCPFLSRDCLAHNMITDSPSNQVFKKWLRVFIWPFSSKTERPRKANTDLESDRSPFLVATACQIVSSRILTAFSCLPWALLHRRCLLQMQMSPAHSKEEPFKSPLLFGHVCGTQQTPSSRGWRHASSSLIEQ